MCVACVLCVFCACWVCMCVLCVVCVRACVMRVSCSSVKFVMFYVVFRRIATTTCSNCHVAVQF